MQDDLGGPDSLAPFVHAMTGTCITTNAAPTRMDLRQ